MKVLSVAGLPDRVTVMVNFICQLGWAMGCPDIWSNIILGISWGCFGMWLTFKWVDWVKQIALPNVGGYHPISWRPAQNKKADLPSNKRAFLLPDCFQGGTLFLFSFMVSSASNWNITSSFKSVSTSFPIITVLTAAPFSTSAFRLQMPQISEPFWGPAVRISLLLIGCPLPPLAGT